MVAWEPEASRFLTRLPTEVEVESSWNLQGSLMFLCQKTVLNSIGMFQLHFFKINKNNQCFILIEIESFLT